MGFNMEYDCKKITEKLTKILYEDEYGKRGSPNIEKPIR